MSTILESNELHRRFLELMLKENLILHLSCEFIEYSSSGIVIPATVSNYVYQNCYVVSPSTQIIDYSRDELPKVKNRLLQTLCSFLISLLARPFRHAGIDSVQVLNNQCLSTNCYSDKWKNLDIARLRSEALTRFPKHSLLLRSLNIRQHPEIVANLKNDGWLPIVNRQVYLILDHKNWLLKKDSKRDLKLLDQADWDFIPLDFRNSRQIYDAKRLYDLLYLEKYSRHNIQFSERFFQEFTKNEIVKVYGLHHLGEMVGVIGLFVMDNTLTIPIVGYDTSKPLKMALYRRLITFSNRYAMENNFVINQSSGAPHFKRIRGAEPTIEYNFVYIDHLPLYQRMVWRFLSWISHILYKPLLERFEL